ncbi:MAG TPA: enolase C-terminal domain-like protein [Methylomirabilota bacterium]|jgi:L-Ala-D/L-Glu epimerase|nr:enolase C-terminal domain-like protein [Methylomirabilota bacterium]
MRITAIEPMLVRVPLREPVHGVHGLTSQQESVLVRVTTDAGSEGWGNVDPTPGYSKVSAERVHAMVERLTPRLAGTDALDVATAQARMAQDGTAASEARAAVEMALLDLKARVQGVPLHALLGARVKDTVTLNAWIGTVTPAQAAREAVAWHERGFRTAKIKISGATDEGVERVAAVRSAVGDRMALRVDFNESLTLEQAPVFIRRLEAYALTLVEQPIPRAEIAGLARIRAEIGIPLMADESVTDDAALAEIIRLGAADLVKVKVMKQGGLLSTLTTIGRAKAAGLRVVLGHGFGLTLSTIAEATVAAVSDAVIDGCEAVGPLKMAGDVVTDPARLDAGVIHLPDSPGLGATIDPNALARYRVR